TQTNQNGEKDKLALQVSFHEVVSLFSGNGCAQLAAILRHAVKPSILPVAGWVTKDRRGQDYYQLPCSLIAIGQPKEGHTVCQFYLLITNDLCAAKTASCKFVQLGLVADLWRCDRNQRRERSPMACFMTSRLTSEIELVSGISLGQTSTQFWAYPHSWMP